ncbi:hypothetical protein B5M09_001466 [Aphanomyces astaci]|uniref:SH2 domain-containing protein n=1 Tax=Aphanomyces astaci TaxID=112090 RepID=A0A425D0H5_APHAT|nr:hypothetical protein B5M09_001466 [Aphanomyces astaci]
MARVCTTTPTTSPKPTDAESSGSNYPYIIAGGAVALIAIGALVFILIRKSGGRNNQEDDDIEVANYAKAVPVQGKDDPSAYGRTTSFATSILPVISHGCRALHFSGHGVPGKVIFESATCEAHFLSQQELKTLLLAGDQPCPESAMRLVFVSACHSESVAEAFVSAGVPHVVVVPKEDKVLDQKAMEFSKAFYTALLAGHSVLKSFEIGQVQANIVTDTHQSKFKLLGCGNHAASHLFSDLPPGPYEDLTPPLPVNECDAVAEAFIGRSLEVHAVFTALAEGARMVSLVGDAGMGKTEVALQACQYATDRHLFERVFFLRLSAVPPAPNLTRYVLTRLAKCFGLLVQGNDLDGLCEHIRDQLDALKADKRLTFLLVLDGCNYLLTNPNERSQLSTIQAILSQVAQLLENHDLSRDEGEFLHYLIPAVIAGLDPASKQHFSTDYCPLLPYTVSSKKEPPSDMSRTHDDKLVPVAALPIACPPPPLHQPPSSSSTPASDGLSPQQLQLFAIKRQVEGSIASSEGCMIWAHAVVEFNKSTASSVDVCQVAALTSVPFEFIGQQVSRYFASKIRQDAVLRPLSTRCMEFLSSSDRIWGTIRSYVIYCLDNATLLGRAGVSPNTRRGLVDLDMFGAFWTWFQPLLSCIKTSQLWGFKHPRLLHGFISKSSCVNMLSPCVPGTFLLRFSETKASCVVVVFVTSGGRVEMVPVEYKHTVPRRFEVYLQDSGAIVSFSTLPELVLNVHVLKFVYPHTPKQNVFQV